MNPELKMQKLKAAAAAIPAEHEIQAVSGRIAEELEKAMAKPGKLGLPKLLDDRRLHYGIPDGAFARQAAFDRVLIYQVAPWKQKTYGNDSSIIMPEAWAEAARQENPRGIIVSAGLQALDVLRTNGMDLGHIITFQRMAPFRTPIDKIAGYQFHLIVQHVGDIIDSEDTQAAISGGMLQLVYNSDEGKHYFISEPGEVVSPQAPWQGGGY